MAKKKSKSEKIEEILKKRIVHGDYSLNGIPSERELCEELNVSRMTARKALKRLLETNYVERLPNGRLLAARRQVEKNLTIGFLVPSVSSSAVERWRLALEKATEDIGAKVHTMMYVHWDAPVILDAIKNLDLVFLCPNAEKIPKRIIKQFQQESDKIIILEQDLSTYGLMSVRLFPSFFVQRLLDKLGSLSHRSVDCFNIQTVDNVIAGRIEQWNLWRAMHNISGSLLGEPLTPYSHPDTPLSGAYKQILSIIDEDKLNATSLFCTTAPAAVGALRAMRDRGIEVGKDVSLCVVNDEGFARYVCPSITSIEMIDPTPYLKLCLERIRNPHNTWSGSLLLQPSEPLIFEGESTGPPPQESGD